MYPRLGPSPRARKCGAPGVPCPECNPTGRPLLPAIAMAYGCFSGFFHSKKPSVTTTDTSWMGLLLASTSASYSSPSAARRVSKQCARIHGVGRRHPLWYPRFTSSAWWLPVTSPLSPGFTVNAFGETYERAATLKCLTAVCPTPSAYRRARRYAIPRLIIVGLAHPEGGVTAFALWVPRRHWSGFR
jgi:hypothetical protein